MFVRYSKMTIFLSGLLLAISFAVAYFSLFWVQVNVLGEFDFLPMVSILFLPAGIKFLAMLVGRHWGLIGIAGGKLLVDRYFGSVSSFTTEFPHLLVWLVIPYICLLTYLKQTNLSQKLDRLTAYHLVVVALLTSFVSSLGTQYYFFGLPEPSYPLLKAIWSMTIGDFSGILVTLGVVIFVRRFVKRSTDSQTKSTTLR
jgi:hypothetical protein